jgi:hypothetical protein
VGAKYWLAERNDNGFGMNVQNKPHEKSNPLILKGIPKLKFTTIYYEATM